MTECELTWIAGILEGEGYFGIIPQNSGRTYCLTVRCKMADQDVIEKLYALTAVGHLCKEIRKPPHKDMWLWHITLRADVIAFLEKILPYMGTRRSERINEMLNFNLIYPVKNILKHGSLRMYNAYGCRCTLCKERKAISRHA